MIRNINFFKIIKSAEAPKLLSVLIDQIFMSLTTFLTTIVLARTYDMNSYADLVLLFSIALFTLGFQSGLISKPYAINQNDFDSQSGNRYFQFNINLKLLFTLCTAIVFPLFYYLSFETWSIFNFSAYLLYIIANTSYFFVKETLLSERKTIENLMYGLACSICLIVLLSIIFYLKNKNIFVFLISASGIYLFLTIVYLNKNYKKSQLALIDFKKFWKINWKLGKWLVGSNLLFHISSNIYPWLLLYITTKNDIAVFGVLISVASLVNPLLTAIGSYLLPIFVQINTNYKKIRLMVKKWNILFGSMSLFLIIIGYFIGQNIIILFFGEKYSNLGLLVIYPFIYQAINIFFQPYKIALNAIKRTDVNFWVLIPRSIITLTLGYFLTNIFGLAGVFYTMITENLFYQLIYYLAYSRIIGYTNSNPE